MKSKKKMLGIVMVVILIFSGGMIAGAGFTHYALQQSNGSIADTYFRKLHRDESLLRMADEDGLQSAETSKLISHLLRMMHVETLALAQSAHDLKWSENVDGLQNLLLRIGANRFVAADRSSDGMAVAEVRECMLSAASKVPRTFEDCTPMVTKAFQVIAREAK